LISTSIPDLNDPPLVWDFSSANAFRLVPEGLVAGKTAAAVVSSGEGRWLAGGPPAFTRARLLWRTAEGAAGEATFGLEALRIWADQAGGGSNLDTALERLSAPRTEIVRVAHKRPKIVGVLNVTPDSFSDGGTFDSTDVAIRHGVTMTEEGADLIDIGGESTRPGAGPVSSEDQCRRILPVIEGLAGRVPLSVDTRSASVMQKSLEAGAAIINDVSALSADPNALDVVAAAGCPVVLMHSLRAPKTMQVAPHYRDIRLDIVDYLDSRIRACVSGGITRDKIIIDPGIGFGQDDEHIALLMRDLAVLHGLGCLLMLGASRKSFIGRVDRPGPAAGRLGGSVAAAILGLARGVQFLRVHDVAQTRQAVAIWAHAEGC
jgi:dihydropteroate synthase